jgi:hypothetical protein
MIVILPPHPPQDDISTCWSSDSGSPQYILIDFEKYIIPTEVRIMFQGGFSGICILIIYTSLPPRRCILLLYFIFV